MHEIDGGLPTEAFRHRLSDITPGIFGAAMLLTFAALRYELPTDRIREMGEDLLDGAPVGLGSVWGKNARV